jgi:uncharacterized membrane protein YhaH (DUF805 family)
MQNAQPTFGRRGGGATASFERTYAPTSSDILDRAMGRGQPTERDVARASDVAKSPRPPAAGGFDVRHLLFSFNGRTRRLHYWMVAIPTSMATQTINVLVLFTGARPSAGGATGLAVAIPILFMLAWIGFAVQFKRLHDRGKSAWWLMMILVPIVGPLWLFVQLGFLAGDPGSNRFGPSPKEPQTDIAEVFA